MLVALLSGCILALQLGSTAASLRSGFDSRRQSWLDPSQPISSRVDALLAEMTLEEKITQLYIVHVANETYIWDNQTLIDSGVGAQKLSLFGQANTAESLVSLRNAYQVHFMNHSRLGIPVSFHTEALSSAGPGATLPPMANALGQTWNSSVGLAVGAVIGHELKALGTDTGYYVIQPVTKPSFGRIEETSSEDPRLAGEMAAALARGMQGGAAAAGTHEAVPAPSTLSYMPADGAVFVAKHFLGYGNEAYNSAPVHVAPYYLRDAYLPVWRAGLWRGGARSLMFMHAAWNGLYAHASPELGQDMLRSQGPGSLGSSALAVSDCACVRNAFRDGMVDTMEESAVLGLRDATVDQELQCGGPADWVYPLLPEAVGQGLLQEAVVDDSVRRVLAAKFALGLFETPFTDPDAWKTELRTPFALQVALESATQAVVLAKNNNGTLPLDLSGVQGNLAVIGPNAACGESGDSPPQGLCFAMVSMIGRLYNQHDPAFTMPTVLDVLKKQRQQDEDENGQAGYTLTFNSGAVINSRTVNETQQQQAVDAAKAASVVLMVLGDSETSCIEGGGLHSGDRDDLDLPGTQVQLLDAVVQAIPASTKLVVMLVNGRPATFGAAGGNAALDRIDALLVGARGGERGAEALVGVMTGTFEPSGRLAQAWPQKGADQLGPMVGPWYHPRLAAWGNTSTHRWDAPVWFGDDPSQDIPLFPFGHGLSYTTFEVAVPTVKVLPVTPAPSSLPETEVNRTIPVGSKAVPVLPGQILAQITCSVTNTGPRRGAFVAEIYAHDPAGLGVVRYYERLLGFGKVWVEPGQQAQVTVDVTADALAITGRPQDGYPWTVPTGTYGVFVGKSSDPNTWTPPGGGFGVPMVVV